jgi:hypothetical protein
VSLEPSGVLYAVARTGFGAAFAVRDWNEGQAGRVVGAQLAAEGCALLFLLGFFDPRLATAVGGWWLPLFVYAICREAVRVHCWYVETVESPSADRASYVETLVAPFPLVWELIGVLPPIVMGGYLAGTAGVRWLETAV